MVEIVYKNRKNLGLKNKNEAENLFKKVKKDKTIGHIRLNPNLRVDVKESDIPTDKEMKDMIYNHNEHLKNYAGCPPLTQEDLEYLKSDVEIIEKPIDDKITKKMIWQVACKLIEGPLINGFPLHEIREVHSHVILMLINNAEFLNKEYDSLKRNFNERGDRKKVLDDKKLKVNCLCCGQYVSYLKQHIRFYHQMTPQEYILKWGLPIDHPFVHPILGNRKRNTMHKYWEKSPRTKKRKKKNEQNNPFD